MNKKFDIRRSQVNKRALHPRSGKASSTTSMGDEERENSVYQVLVDRLRNLEEKQTKLQEQFDELVQEKKLSVNDNEKSTAVSTAGFLSGFFFSRSPYASILKCMGHAVHVLGISSGEIIYWNHSAETLYGWKDYEIIGRRVVDFLVAVEYYASLQKILERLITGVPWCGQFPFKKRSGEVFMALVTKTPLYEDGQLVGIITVSSDTAVFNCKDSETRRTHQSGANGQPGVQRLNLKGIQWPPRPLIAPIPQIASSVSNLATKLLPLRHTDIAVAKNTSTDVDDEISEKCKIDKTSQSKSHHEKNTTVLEASEKDYSTTEVGQPSKIAARVLAKLQIGGIGKCGKGTGSVKDNCRTDYHSGGKRVNNENDLFGGSVTLTPQQDVSNGVDKEENLQKCNSLFVFNRPYTKTGAFKDCSAKPFSEDCSEYIVSARPQDPLLRLHCQYDPKKLEPEARNIVIEGEVQKQQEGLQLPSPGEESIDSHESSSSKEGSESNSVIKTEIHWEDLQLREEIGQGSFAVVYHGVWNGSDVAIKVYYGDEYTEETLQGYRKEIDIMTRLRHPNVLLFMGAVYSQERLAIVTELLPRGSLFKTLHNNQTLDIRRRLRMALDVARGMNYLHHRNPPILHRDLKSSNLLVDKNWTVKVGDFGLSRLKDATLLTTKSGRGTPQWMAPEVLRNEPSNEKSDVFSFGVILWELIVQSVPWKDLSYLQVVGVVGFMDRRLDLPEGLDPDVASIINDCWRSDPKQRPSFEELIQRMMFVLNRATAVSEKRNAES